MATPRNTSEIRASVKEKLATLLKKRLEQARPPVTTVAEFMDLAKREGYVDVAHLVNKAIENSRSLNGILFLGFVDKLQAVEESEQRGESPSGLNDDPFLVELLKSILFPGYLRQVAKALEGALQQEAFANEIKDLMDQCKENGIKAVVDSQIKLIKPPTIINELLREIVEEKYGEAILPVLRKVTIENCRGYLKQEELKPPKPVQPGELIKGVREVGIFTPPKPEIMQIISRRYQENMQQKAIQLDPDEQAKMYGELMKQWQEVWNLFTPIGDAVGDKKVRAMLFKDGLKDDKKLAPELDKNLKYATLNRLHRNLFWIRGWLDERKNSSDITTLIRDQFVGKIREGLITPLIELIEVSNSRTIIGKSNVAKAAEAALEKMKGLFPDSSPEPEASPSTSKPRPR